MARLFLIRHGHSAPDDLARYWGHTDLPLSTEGTRQAMSLRGRLAKEKVAAVYSSDLRRALNTANAIAEPHRVRVTLCPELREIDFGDCEGLTYDEIKRSCPEVEPVWWGTHLHLSFPRGETLGALVQRVDRFAGRLSECSFSDGAAVVVAHGGSLRVLVCRLTGVALSHWWQMRIDAASLSILETFPHGAVVCLLNDRCHLDSH